MLGLMLQPVFIHLKHRYTVLKVFKDVVALVLNPAIKFNQGWCTIVRMVNHALFAPSF